MLPEGTTADESVSIEAAHSSTHDEAQLPGNLPQQHKFQLTWNLVSLLKAFFGLNLLKHTICLSLLI